MTSSPLRIARHMALLLGALYVSEGWYATWRNGGPLHRKARAIVVFDRVLCDDYTSAEAA